MIQSNQYPAEKLQLHVSLSHQREQQLNKLNRTRTDSANEAYSCEGAQHQLNTRQAAIRRGTEAILDTRVNHALSETTFIAGVPRVRVGRRSQRIGKNESKGWRLMPRELSVLTKRV
jgi:hypothetical protein